MEAPEKINEVQRSRSLKDKAPLRLREGCEFENKKEKCKIRATGCSGEVRNFSDQVQFPTRTHSWNYNSNNSYLNLSLEADKEKTRDRTESVQRIRLTNLLTRLNKQDRNSYINVSVQNNSARMAELGQTHLALDQITHTSSEGSKILRNSLSRRSDEGIKFVKIISIQHLNSGEGFSGDESKELLLKTELGDAIADIDSEYLTKNGWKNVSELEEGDYIALSEDLDGNNKVKEESEDLTDNLNKSYMPLEKEKCKGRVAQRKEQCCDSALDPGSINELYCGFGNPGTPAQIKTNDDNSYLNLSLEDSFVKIISIEHLWEGLLLKTELGDLTADINEEYLTKNGWKNVSELEEGDYIAIPKSQNELYNNDKASLGESILTLSCLINPLSPESIGQLSFNASAKYGASLGCGANSFALGKNCKNSSAGIKVIESIRKSYTSSNSCSDKAVNVSALALCFLTSSSRNSGATNSNLSKIAFNENTENGIPFLIKEETTVLASTTTLSNIDHLLENLADNLLYLLANDMLTSSANSLACSSVNLDLATILLNLTSFDNSSLSSLLTKIDNSTFGISLNSDSNSPGISTFNSDILTELINKAYLNVLEEENNEKEENQANSLDKEPVSLRGISHEFDYNSESAETRTLQFIGNSSYLNLSPLNFNSNLVQHASLLFTFKQNQTNFINIFQTWKLKEKQPA